MTGKPAMEEGHHKEGRKGESRRVLPYFIPKLQAAMLYLGYPEVIRGSRRLINGDRPLDAGQQRQTTETTCWKRSAGERPLDIKHR